MPDELGTVLSKLRDIHEPMSWFSWPLPIGWWLILICLLLTVLSLAWWWYQRTKGDRPYRELRRVAVDLQGQFRAGQIDNVTYINRANQLLKYLLIHVEHQSSAIRADGQGWILMLAHRFKDDRFVHGAGKVLSNIRYTPGDFFDADFENLIDETLCLVGPSKSR